MMGTAARPLPEPTPASLQKLAPAMPIVDWPVS
jgi:hypothetical protein